MFAPLAHRLTPAMPSPPVLDVKKTLRERYGVQSFALFGSYARGEHDPRQRH